MTSIEVHAWAVCHWHSGKWQVSMARLHHKGRRLAVLSSAAHILQAGSSHQLSSIQSIVLMI